MSAAKTPVTLVSRHSDEHAKVEHALQLSVRSTASKDVSIWGISNPTMNIQFERRSGGLLTLDAWVDVNSLDMNTNPLEEVCRRGFILSDATKGLEFQVGNINFPANGQINHQYMLCSVVVGRAYVVDGSATASSESEGGASGPPSETGLKPPPTGYDSVYLHMGDAAVVVGSGGGGVSSGPAGGTHETNGSPSSSSSLSLSYTHRYVVFDASQVIPRYVVHFSYDPSERLTRSPVRAVDLSDIKSRIAETLAVLGPAAAEATEKMLSDIGVAYDAALASSHEADPLLEERRRSILEALKSVDNKLSAIQANSQQLEEELFKRLQAAMFQLQDETQRKTDALLSEELELRRQLGQIEWNTSFVKVLQDTLPPMSFVSAWERHAKLRSGLYAALGGRVSTRGLDDIQADMRLEGAINVVTAAKAAAAAAAAVASSSAATSSSAGARFFGAASASSSLSASAVSSVTSATTQSVIAPPPPPTPAPAAPVSAAAVNDIWASVLKGAIAPPTTTTTTSPPPPPASTSTVEQAAAKLAVAKAELAAIESTAAALPRDTRSQMNSALAEAAARVHDSEVSMHAASASSSSVKQNAPAASSVIIGAGGAGSMPTPATVPATTTASAATAPLSRSMQAPLEQRTARFSLRKEAERRRRQRGLEIDPALAFNGSDILTPDQANMLYTCLPFGAGTGDDGMGGTSDLGLMPPATRQLFSSLRDADPSILGIRTAYSGAGHNDATVILVRANGQVFGGFAADPWDLFNNDLFSGTPRCFLFSITKDAKIPYTGRVKGPRQANDEILRAEWEAANTRAAEEFQEMLTQAREMNGGADPEFDEAGRLWVRQTDQVTGQPMTIRVPVPRPKPFIRYDCIKSNPDGMQFGVSDLILTGDFSECSSDLEHSYGLGLRADEAKTFLANAPFFRAEAVEVWAVSSSGSVGAGGAGGGGMMMMNMNNNNNNGMGNGGGGEYNSGSFSTPGPNSSRSQQQDGMFN